MNERMLRGVDWWLKDDPRVKRTDWVPRLYGAEPLDHEIPRSERVGLWLAVHRS